jgi:hypothetical protein
MQPAALHSGGGGSGGPEYDQAGTDAPLTRGPSLRGGGRRDVNEMKAAASNIEAQLNAAQGGGGGGGPRSSRGGAVTPHVDSP